MDYTLVRMERKTVSVEVKNNETIVRAPLRMSRRDVDAFVSRHAAWIERQRERQAQRTHLPVTPLTEEEISALLSRAKEVIPQRAAYYAAQIGVTYNRICIKRLHSRWGSCSEKKNLNFNCLLMLAPAEVVDAVVVHELCHLKQMNHSPAFYREVLRVFPDYHRHDRWLREHGEELLARLP